MSQTTGTTNLTVLYIDDNQSNGQLLTRRLEHLGAKCITSIDAWNTVDLILEHKPDIVLLDLHMPGISGFDVLKTIRKHQSMDALPVWAFSANSIGEMRSKCIEAGFDEFMAKPITRDDVKMIISQFAAK